LYPSESSRRFRDSRTRRYPFIYTCTYVRVISLSFRNIRWRGKVVEDETYLAGSVISPSCLPQLRARRMCFQHTIVNTFYFFVYTELLSVYRWNRAAPDPLSIGHSSRWRDSEGLWKLKADNKALRSLAYVYCTSSMREHFFFLSVI